MSVWDEIARYHLPVVCCINTRGNLPHVWKDWLITRL